MEVKTGITTVNMKNGENGATFKPQIINGILSWTNDKGLQNPPPFALLPNVVGGFTQSTYTLTDNDYFTGGKMNLIKMGNMCVLSLGYTVVSKIPNNYKIGTIDPQYVPLTEKIISCTSTGGFTFLKILSNGDVIYEGGDQNMDYTKNFLDIFYNVF